MRLVYEVRIRFGTRINTKVMNCDLHLHPCDGLWLMMIPPESSCDAYMYMQIPHRTFVL